jgi:hypothetical protein
MCFFVLNNCAFNFIIRNNFGILEILYRYFARLFCMHNMTLSMTETIEYWRYNGPYTE